MPAKPTKLYPIARHFLQGVPAAVHVVASRAEADELIATGAFTDDPKHPDRDLDAADLTAPPPVEPVAGPVPDQPATPDPVDQPTSEPDQPAEPKE